MNTKPKNISIPSAFLAYDSYGIDDCNSYSFSNVSASAHYKKDRASFLADPSCLVMEIIKLWGLLELGLNNQFSML